MGHPQKIDQYIVGAERGQGINRPAPHLGEAARLSFEQQRTKDWNCPITPRDYFNHATVAVMKRLELGNRMLQIVGMWQRRRHEGTLFEIAFRLIRSSEMDFRTQPRSRVRARSLSIVCTLRVPHFATVPPPSFGSRPSQ